MINPNIDYLSSCQRPVWRGRVHAVAAMIVPVASTYLLTIASGVLAIFVSILYTLSLFTCYCISGFYHVLARTPSRQEVFQRLDHASIFLLIAGTYTPFCVLALPYPECWIALGIVWITAIIGLVLKLTRRAWRLATGLYLAIGWCMLAFMPGLYARTGAWIVGLLLFGGAIYTIGAVLFLKHKPVLKSDIFGFHEFWHVMTVLAGIAHFIAVVLLLQSIGT
jgi:hemolysin III